LARIRHHLPGDVLLNILAVDLRLVAERIAAVGGAEDGAAARQDAADVVEREFARALRPDQPIETVFDADHLPAVAADRALHRRADHRVQPGAIAAAGADANGADCGSAGLAAGRVGRHPKRRSPSRSWSR